MSWLIGLKFIMFVGNMRDSIYFRKCVNIKKNFSIVKKVIFKKLLYWLFNVVFIMNFKYLFYFLFCFIKWLLNI